MTTYLPAGTAAIVARAIGSINQACDWVEAGDADDAIELLNLVLNDLEPLAEDEEVAASP